MLSKHEVLIRQTAEGILREEIRALRDTGFKVVQWGVAILFTELTALYYIRKDIYSKLIELKKLPATKMFLPWNYYFVGTIIIIVTALIFAILTGMLVSRFNSYRLQLISNNQSGIVELPHSSRLKLISLYFVFSLIDILIKIAAELW